LPTFNTILSAFLIAIFLNIALPPTVKDDINAAIIILISVPFIKNVVDILIASIAPIEPDIIPHTSPTISLQKDDILLLF